MCPSTMHNPEKFSEYRLFRNQRQADLEFPPKVELSTPLRRYWQRGWVRNGKSVPYLHNARTKRVIFSSPSGPLPCEISTFWFWLDACYLYRREIKSSSRSRGRSSVISPS